MPPGDKHDAALAGMMAINNHVLRQSLAVLHAAQVTRLETMRFLGFPSSLVQHEAAQAAVIIKSLEALL